MKELSSHTSPSCAVLMHTKYPHINSHHVAFKPPKYHILIHVNEVPVWPKSSLHDERCWGRINTPLFITFGVPLNIQHPGKWRAWDSWLPTHAHPPPTPEENIDSFGGKPPKLRNSLRFSSFCFKGTESHIHLEKQELTGCWTRQKKNNYSKTKPSWRDLWTPEPLLTPSLWEGVLKPTISLFCFSFCGNSPQSPHTRSSPASSPLQSPGSTKRDRGWCCVAGMFKRIMKP